MRRSLLPLFLAACSASAAPSRHWFVGTPGNPTTAVWDDRGRWGVGDGTVAAPAIEHWLYDPLEKKERNPYDGSARSSLFRDMLPFPQVKWGSGDFEVTQLLYPAWNDGFVVRYHVMNHGSDPREVRLLVGTRGASEAMPSLVPSPAPSEKAASYLAFDLKIEPGTSRFVFLVTPGAAGRDPAEALDEASERWEKILARPITIPDAAAQSAYVQALADRVAKIRGAEETVRSFERRLVRREGDALRLLGEVPEEWLLEAIEVKGLQTDFGPLSFRHTGFYDNRTLDLEPGCSPPGGFLMSVGPRHRPKIDGKAAEAKEGLLRIPPGARRVELARPL